MIRTTLRRLVMGLSTVLGFGQRGFFIPYRYAAGIKPAGERPAYDAVEAHFVAEEDTFERLIEAIDSLAVDLRSIGFESPPAPRWDQSWFPRADAAAAYAMVRALKPKRIIEVGSGHSTRFLARAVKDGTLETHITAIDPAPRAGIGELGVETIPTTLQDADPAIFATLQSGDFLFIDSSHILMPGTDVDILFNRILPTLPSGVLIHIHDIFLPDDYPKNWDWRGYNEQLAVSTLILGNAYEVLWSSRYATTRMAERLDASALGRIPMPDEALESSLWLRKKSGNDA